jgi:hypothetical protein
MARNKAKRRLQGMARISTWNRGHNGLDMHDDAPARMGLGGLFTVFGVKLAVLNRPSTGIDGKDQASDMGTPRV